MDCPKCSTVKRETVSEKENAKTDDFQHQEVCFPSRGACSPQKASSSPREELQALGQPALVLLSGHLCANSCWRDINLLWAQQEERTKAFFSLNGRAFLSSSRKGAANKGIMPIKREEGAGFELQKKPAHYSKGSCKVQGHIVKEKKRKGIQSLSSIHQSDNVIAWYVYSSLAAAAAAFPWGWA